MAVTNVYYINASQSLTAFAAGDYIVSTDPMGTYSRNIFFENSPSSITDDSIKYIIEISEGFNPVGTSSVDPDTIFPMAIKHAALLMIGQYYDNRNAVVIGATQNAMSLGFEYLLDPYKIQILI